MSDTQPTLDQVQGELAKLAVPAPSEWMEDLTPPAALLYMKAVAESAMTIVAGAVKDAPPEGEDADDLAAALVSGCAMALAGATHALVALGVLPEAAEEALEQANNGKV